MERSALGPGAVVTIHAPSLTLRHLPNIADTQRQLPAPDDLVSALLDPVEVWP